MLLIDIINSSRCAATSSARSAEELPLRVAGRLLSAAREIDSVARLSDHRFGMLVEGPLTPDDAASDGPRVVARCLMPFKNKPDRVGGAGAGGAGAWCPPSAPTRSSLVERLEALLCSVAADSKRAVFSLTLAVPAIAHSAPADAPRRRPWPDAGNPAGCRPAWW